MLNILNATLLSDCESPNRFYLEVSPNCRYIFEDGTCVGYYDPSLGKILQ